MPDREIDASDDIGPTIGEGLILHGHGPDSEAIRIRESLTGLSLSADLSAGTTTSVASATAPPSHGEEGTPETCGMFVAYRNSHGGSFAAPVPLAPGKERGVDCEALDTLGGPPLRMQVVRAYLDGKFWRLLKPVTPGQYETATVPAGTVSDWVHALWEAVCDKQDLRPGPGVVLLLNARRTPWLAFRLVGEEFRRVHGRDARRIADAAPFDSIWVVAPGDLVERLDVP
jgi:hypothetical protein